MALFLPQPKIHCLTLGLWLCTTANIALATDNLAGFWWTPTNPSWGLSIQQQCTHTFAVWFTYNAQHSPTWYALQCDFMQTDHDSRCSGEAFSGAGSPYTTITDSANAQFIATGQATLIQQPTGTLTLDVTDANDPPQHLSNLVRLKLNANIELPKCSLQATTRVTANNYTDFWWGGPSASGWGMHINQQGSQLFLSWGTYDAQGKATWLFGLGTQDGLALRHFSGTLYQFPNGTPPAAPEIPVPPNANELGGFDLQFSNGEQGQLTYSLSNGASKQHRLPLQRLATSGAGDTTLCNDIIPRTPAQQAARFLTQATFGARFTDINALVASNNDYSNWLNTQFAIPQTLHLPGVQNYFLSLPNDQQSKVNPALSWSIWKNFTLANDALRQRISFALSEIFVISLDSTLKNYPLGPTQYLDMLGKHAFGNYRELLNAITYSPMMGIYLSSLHNQKENPKTGSVPDENFAREIMQLFSIGLYQLNLDGSLVVDAQGKPIETYNNADITGLAKVFTGLSWAGPDTSSNRFFSNRSKDLDAQIAPMQAYNQYHSTAEKLFLGVTLAAQHTADADADIRKALDTLFNHPNVGPFIGKQLIQRLVSSNPSPAYVARVASVFNNNGQGVRGDLRAVIRAVLLDVEARDPALAPPHAGKLREPVVRFVQWLRCFNATSNNGAFLLGTTAKPDSQLAQSPLLAPSVFNFFRPNFIPPHSNTGNVGLLAPEAQITTETSIAGYLNFMRTAINSGVGTKNDIQADYTAELAIADNATLLVERVSLLLAANLTANTQNLIRDAVNSIPLNNASARLNRVKLAIYLTMASPEYLFQN